MKKCTICMLLACCTIFAQAQSPADTKAKFLKIALSNSHSNKPFASFSSLFYKDFHPGVDLGYEIVMKNGKRYQWLLETRTAYMYHRFVQHNISLYGDAGYCYKIMTAWSAEAKIGAGYQLSIPHGQVYKITESEGLKKKSNLGRSQLVANFNIAVNRHLSERSGTRIFIEYKQQIQTPFIKEYVPLLPYNSILLGLAALIRRSN